MPVALIDLAEDTELAEGETKVLAYDGKPPFRSIVLLKIEKEHRAYWNICQHVSIPLDGGLGSLPLVKGELVCITHGARYRPQDGMCVKGPCKDKALVPLEIELQQGRVFVNIPEGEL